VVGSINVDIVVAAPRLPGPGETVTGGDAIRHHGGKGGNQAVAAARLGARVTLVGAVGDDDFGIAARAALVADGVDVAHVASVARPTGVALIVVDERAENLIAVAPGANGAVSVSAVEAAMLALRLGPADVVLTCREIPPPAVRAALDAARSAGATGILNTAPADGLDRDTLALADILTPNATELAIIAGPGEPEAAARTLLADDDAVRVGPEDHRVGGGGLVGGRGGRAVIVTLGPAGALLVPAGSPATSMPALAVLPVDTTGAGDTFNGALAAGLAAGLPLADATLRAVAAAGLSTVRPGAREGMPTAIELAAALAVE
jgi:ribokinase